MTQFLFAGVLVLIIWALWANHPVIKTLARVFTGLLTLTFASASVLLFHVGQKAHWTSDGPGMLAIMIGFVFFGFLAFLFGGLFFQSLTRSATSTEHNG